MPPLAAPQTPPVAPQFSAGATTRIAAAVIAAALLAVLTLAAMLHADPAGHGTHRQIGLPPCGFALTTGRPCPTCGMTTAFAHAAHGDYRQGFLTQPAGLLTSLGVAAFFWACLHTAWTGSRSLELCGKLLTPKALWIVGGVWLGSWVYTFLTWTPV